MQQALLTNFGDCKFATSSQCRTKSSYESTNENEFFIFDPPPETNRPIAIVDFSVEHQLKVKNPEGKHICVVKTDRCLFLQDVPKCDCMLFSEKDLYFVEIKDTKVSQRHASRQKAVEQLEATIKSLQERQVDYLAFASTAVICFKSKSEYPIRASFLQQKAIFLEKYNVSLKEGDTIEF